MVNNSRAVTSEITTYLENLIDPEVLADMISAQLPNAIKFSAIAPIDTTLEGQPGSTITIPKYEYIGDAEDVAEGKPIPYSELQTTTQQVTVKKVGKGVELTDEAVLSGYGDPVGEAQKQIRMSIASKIDNDILECALTAELKVNHAINLDLIDQLEDTFEEAPDAIESEQVGITGLIFVNPKDARKLRREAGVNWTRASDLGDRILVTGVIGEILGWQIATSKKLNAGEAIAVKTGAMKTYLKRGLLAERGRDMDHKITKFNADQHYAVAIHNDTKIVKVVSTTETRSTKAS